MALPRLVLLLWKEVYVRRFRRHLLATVAQIVFALLVLCTLSTDISNEPAAQVGSANRSVFHRDRGTRAPVPGQQYKARRKSHPNLKEVTGVPKPKRQPSRFEPHAMPEMTFQPWHPLQGWHNGPGAKVEKFCFVSATPVFAPVARHAARILNISQVVQLKGKNEVTPYFNALYKPATDQPSSGRLIAIVFNEGSYPVSQSTSSQADRELTRGILKDGPWELDYEVRVNDVKFDVNVHYRRFLVLPGALDLQAFGETTYLLPIQYAVETAFLQAVSSARRKPFDYQVLLHRFPYPSFYPENFPTTYARVVIRFAIAFWLPFTLFVVQIVDERASGMQELMRVYGVGDALFWFSHYLSLQTFVAVLSAFALSLFYGLLSDDAGKPFIVATNPALVYLVLLSFGSALAVQAMFIALFFNSTRLACLLSSVHWCLNLMLPYVFLQNPLGFGYYLISRRGKLLSSVFPGMFLHWCWMLIERLERFRGQGALDIFVSDERISDNVTVAQLIAVSAGSSLLLAFLTWYIDNVTTCNGNKIAKPYAFLLTKYGLKPVLNDINLNVFGKQITVVFSPPDSGKTTMMKLITGCLAPDNGSITVGSCDVGNNAEGARRVLAYCPYNGTLFDDLTVEEHLTFFGTAKGGFGDQVRRDVSRLMRDTGLSRYRGWYVDELNPAQQRLLSAATAMMPYAEVEMIVMDEPTHNMDPSSRRELWEVLLKLRRERGVLLTTSDYAEAEALADRIVVLNRGTIFCAGSPEYIKSQFGMGYLLRLEKGRGYRAAAVDALIYKQAPAAGKAEENASSVVYRLTGFSDLLASLMRDILYDLEKSKRTLGVARIGIKVTTMEDVLQGISDRRSTPCSRDQSVFLRKGEAPSSKEPSVVATKADVGWLLPVSAGGMAALKMLRGRSRDDPSSVSTVRALMHKRLLDWVRSVALRAPYWLLPSALLLLGGYCENALLASVPTLRTTLTYDVQEIVGPAIGFCGATQNGSLRALVMQRACPLLEGSGVRLRSIDLTQVESQLLSLAADDVRDYVFRYTMGVVTADRERRFALWFNGQNPHAALLALNLLHIALLRDITGDPESFMRLTNTPDNFQAVESEDTLLNFFREFELSRVRRESAGYVVHAVLVRVLCAVFLPAALCYHAAHFVLPVLVERMSAAKHLQLMAGLSGAVYWLGHLLFDVFLCVAHALLFTAAAVAFRSFLGWPYIQAVFLIFVMYGVLSANLAYLASFWFDDATKAFYTMTTMYIFGGVFGALLTTAADMLAFSASPPTLQVLIEIVMTVPIRWLPTYIVTRGFTKLILLHKESLICAEGGLLLKHYCEKNFLRFTTSLAQCCPQYGEAHPKREHRSVDEPLSASFYSGFFELSALFLEACFCFAAAAFLDSDLLQRLWSHLETGRESYEYAQPTVDADVRKERKLVDEICNQRAFAQHALVVHCLSKAYGFLQPRLAVDDVSFALRRGECLGLVGVLGTGKSTLLGVLGGELFPSSGDAYMSSLSLTRHYRQWMQSVGYVPYDWGLVDGLTGREMICVLATLRGVQDVPRTTACALRVVELAEPDAPIASYGAGAKTQLSLALALMSLPRLYLLDLPELDAPSRTVVRRVLELLRPTSSVVLTCEHLHHFEGVCDRIAILVAGRIECLGSLKDLSDKYCRGTTIVIYTYPDRKYDVDHQRFIAIEMIEHFPTCTLERCYEGQLEFRIAETQASLGEMFDRLLYIKRRRKFHLFYVSDTTMDQIFASLGRKHAGLQARE